MPLRVKVIQLALQLVTLAGKLLHHAPQDLGGHRLVLAELPPDLLKPDLHSGKLDPKALLLPIVSHVQGADVALLGAADHQVLNKLVQAGEVHADLAAPRAAALVAPGVARRAGQLRAELAATQPAGCSSFAGTC